MRSPLRRTLRSRRAACPAAARHFVRYSALPFASLHPRTTLTTLPRQPLRRLTWGALCACKHMHPTDHVNIVDTLTRSKGGKPPHCHRAARTDPPPLARPAAPAFPPHSFARLSCAHRRAATPSAAPTMIDMLATVPGTAVVPCQRHPVAARPCCTSSPLAARRHRVLTRW